ncbi:DNA-3-methyladenine glycosylase I [Thalassospira xiamenensis]|uniref:DNA-3-methyladenine glycosylase I n=1 Tax=Thalassospira xiamenensis TaxID=220697 RepID=A0A367XE12_9PROT|nr:DNA-3-methyladenine glycosylase I [Thalassospira xiamenensis]KZB56827.1 DNA-3-methyladenine glycosylase [Thalassospira xiamenensis]RCK51905.1 DNA-3-methyladenine glycosylase [Thalassospira xiamenensis]
MSTNTLPRCKWAETHLDKPFYVDYHDQEWGVPVHDDRHFFEMLILEGAQAGLSWLTILARRDTYRAAYDNFDVQKIAKYDEAKQQSLLADPGIIRNRAKVAASILNANAFIEIQKEFGSFDAYIWDFIGGKPVINNWKAMSDVPVSTALSDALSKDLKKRGMKFVGTTIMYSFMQATGLVMDHTTDCHCYAALSGKSA